MKIVKLLPLFFLSILFTLVLPHFYNQAHADPTFDEFTIPTSGSGTNNITSGPDGNLWFTEFNTAKIGKITTGGTFTEFSIPSPGAGPSGITSGPDGNLWFTLYDTTQIAKITPSGTITEYSLPSGFSVPQEISAGPDGNLWFTDSQ